MLFRLPNIHFNRSYQGILKIHYFQFEFVILPEIAIRISQNSFFTITVTVNSELSNMMLNVIVILFQLQ